MALGVHHGQLTFEFQVLEAGGVLVTIFLQKVKVEVTEMDQFCGFLGFTLCGLFVLEDGVREMGAVGISHSPSFSGKRCHARGYLCECPSSCFLPPLQSMGH